MRLDLRGSLDILFGWLQDKLDLEYARPQFAGDEQTLVIWIVGDSVEHGA
jgi:hypothetical protein